MKLECINENSSRREGFFMHWIINGEVHTMTEDKVYEGGYIAYISSDERRGQENTEGEKEYGKGEQKYEEAPAKGKIVYVGPPCEIPKGDTVIDAAGCFVMPGIVEAHCHMGITEEKIGMEGDDCNEATNPITPYLRAIDAINPMDPAFHHAIQAGITSVMVGPGSANVVGGQFAFLKTQGRCMDDMIVKAPAAMKISFGENPKTQYGGGNQMPATRMAIAGMLREELFKARAYYERKQRTPKEEFQLDFRLEPWIPVLEKQIPLKAHAHRADDILTAIRIAREYDLDMTLDHCTEGHLIAKEIKESRYPVICGPHLANRNKIEICNADFKTPGILAKQGILVAMMTDHPVSLIQYLPLCAAYAVKKGMEPEEALRAITVNAARICQVADRVGSLQPGLDADIVVFQGNPLKVESNVRYTIIDGTLIYDSSADSRGKDSQAG